MHFLKSFKYFKNFRLFKNFLKHKMSAQNQPQRTKTDISFWDKQWKDMNIGFHMDKFHPMLTKHIQLLLENRQNVRFFFPLCGKAWDLRWIASLGHQVVGVESNQTALEQFFTEGNLKYILEEKDGFKIFSSEDGRIRLYCGDFLKFTNKFEEAMDCVWDRGSLVALPENIRDRYAEHILTLLKPNFRYLLDTFTYNRDLYPGPPHSVDRQEVERLYSAKCSIELVDTDTYRAFTEKMHNDLPKEIVYLLKPLN